MGDHYALGLCRTDIVHSHVMTPRDQSYQETLIVPFFALRITAGMRS